MTNRRRLRTDYLDASFRQMIFDAEEAVSRAERLLKQHLTRRQRFQLMAHGWFKTETEDCVWRIGRDRVTLRDKQRDYSYDVCIRFRATAQPPPRADLMLAVKLMAETDETRLRMLAVPL